MAASLEGTFDETLDSLSNLTLSSNKPAPRQTRQQQRHYWICGVPWHSEYELYLMREVHTNDGLEALGPYA